MLGNYINTRARFILNGKSYESTDFLNLNFTEDWLRDVQYIVEFWCGDEESLAVTTSGSTGNPKEIHLKRETFLASAKATISAFNLTPGSKALLYLPCKFIGGKMMVIRALVGGWDLHLWEPKAVLPAVEEAFGFVALTPMQASGSLSTLNQFKTILLGGGAVSHELHEELNELNSRIYLSYGMTETASHVALRKLNGPEASEEFCAINDVSFSVDNRICLQIHAPLLVSGSLQTNDLVELKDSTHFVWKGRMDNIINSGGLKIVPEEVERKLEPIIKRPFFVGALPDKELGQKPTLFVESKQPLNIDLGGLEREYHLKNIIFLKAFKYTETHKVNRIETQKLEK